MNSDELLQGVSSAEIDAIIAIEHANPHRVLGAHPTTLAGKRGAVVRTYHPDAASATIIVEGNVIPMRATDHAGLFCVFLPDKHPPFDYRVRFAFPHGGTWESRCPYRFLPTLGEQDLYYVGEGTHYRLYEKLGAHLRTMEGVQGASFAVWAPNARRVSVIGDFCNWDGRLYPMRNMGSTGIWELFIPGVAQGAFYKYEIKTQSGELRIKTDPYAFCVELRPGTASRVWDIDAYEWGDGEWIEKRRGRNPYSSPMNIYEVHLGSWSRSSTEGGMRWPNYREMAPELVQHLKTYGFTHVEFMPVMEHPLDASWGYQVTGYYAPTSRFGTPDDFMFLVDTLHRHGIGVILDWVPAHFPKDDFALRLFDGTALYEHEDPRKGEHRDWGTLIFNYGRTEVRNFLVGNALFWLDKYHVDGLRVDAVASILYLDYSRNEGEWIPNEYGGRENLEAIAFLKEMNTVVYGRFPGCVTIAEESTAWTGVTKPTYLGGLGFGFKWDMGWMHDTLEYFSKDCIHRSYHHNDLTFSMMYAYSENFILPLSHDEVVYGKGSLLRKMPGDDWQKFANLRLLFAYLYTHPGKKLLIAGSELGTWNEWSHEGELERRLLQYTPHRQISQFVRDLGALYREDSALWSWDHAPEGFSWIDCHDHANSVVSYLRRGPDGFLVCALNFTPVIRENYVIGVPEGGTYEEVINSDSTYYGGSNVGNGGLIVTSDQAAHGFPRSLKVVLPPLACVIFRPRNR
jgi:1,4-alpha-glucan branching enzyme